MNKADATTYTPEENASLKKYTEKRLRDAKQSVADIEADIAKMKRTLHNLNNQELYKKLLDDHKAAVSKLHALQNATPEEMRRLKALSGLVLKRRLKKTVASAMDSPKHALSRCTFAGTAQISGTCWLNGFMNVIFLNHAMRNVMWKHWKAMSAAERTSICGDDYETTKRCFTYAACVRPPNDALNDLDKSWIKTVRRMVFGVFANLVASSHGKRSSMWDQGDYVKSMGAYFKLWSKLEKITWIDPRKKELHTPDLLQAQENWNAYAVKSYGEAGLTNWVKSFFFAVFGTKGFASGDFILTNNAHVQNKSFEMTSSIIYIAAGDKAHVATGFVCDGKDYVYDANYNGVVIPCRWRQNDFELLRRFYFISDILPNDDNMIIKCDWYVFTRKSKDNGRTPIPTQTLTTVKYDAYTKDDEFQSFLKTYYEIIDVLVRRSVYDKWDIVKDEQLDSFDFIMQALEIETSKLNEYMSMFPDVPTERLESTLRRAFYCTARKDIETLESMVGNKISLRIPPLHFTDHLLIKLRQRVDNSKILHHSNAVLHAISHAIDAIKNNKDLTTYNCP